MRFPFFALGAAIVLQQCGSPDRPPFLPGTGRDGGTNGDSGLGPLDGSTAISDRGNVPASDSPSGSDGNPVPVDDGGLRSDVMPTPADVTVTGDASTNPGAWMGWPLGGEQNVEWAITNFVDDDPAPTLVADYSGRSGADARTYDGHTGVDIALPTFRQQDRGVNVYPVAPGVVVRFQHSFPDRRTSGFVAGCNDVLNYVRILHANGFSTEYLHIREASVRVNVGDNVTPSTIIASVGSSGCSTGPHLHLTVLSPSGAAVDPFAEDLFMDEPLYESGLQAMEIIVKETPFATTADYLTSLPNVSAFNARATLYLGAVFGGGRAGDTFLFRTKNPRGLTHSEFPVTLSRIAGMSYWWTSNRLTDEAGRWSVELHSAGSVMRSAVFDVR